MLGQAINGAGLVGNLHQNRITSFNLNFTVAVRKCTEKKQMDEKMTNSEEDFPVIVSSLPAVGIPTSYPRIISNSSNIFSITKSQKISH